MARHKPRRSSTGRSQTVLLDPALEGARPADIVIPIMGATGSGKSTFINHLLEHIGDGRTPVMVGHQQSPCTVDLQPIVISNQIQRRGVAFVNLANEHRIVILDTPGFEDATTSDFQILKRISKWLEESLKRKMTLGGVIYLHDISQNEFLGTARKNLKNLSCLCGEAALDKVVLVTSKWSRQGERDFAKLEDELKDGHWKDMLQRKGGASVMRLNPQKDGGEGASAWAVVCRVLQQLDRRLSQKMHDDVLTIETGAKERKVVRETIAAKEIREEIEGLSRALEEMQALETSAEEGNSDADRKIREKEEQLHAMHEVISQNRAPLSARMASRFRRLKRLRRLGFFSWRR